MRNNAILNSYFSSFCMASFRYFVFSPGVISSFRYFAWRFFVISSFRLALFRLFALICRHFAWRISFFRLFAWRYFVFSLFRLAFFRYFVFSLGVISSWRRAITPGEKTKERNNEMAQTSPHIYARFDRFIIWVVFLRILGG